MATSLVTLPVGVLDHSRECGGIDARDILSLVEAGYALEAVYPISKRYDADPHGQLAFFDQLVPVLRQRNRYELHDFLLLEARALVDAERHLRFQSTRPLSNVRVAQLIQYNRLGREGWRDQLESVAFQCGRKDIEPMLVAYAMLAGLPSILWHAHRCYVLNPGWIADPQNPFCGVHLAFEYDAPARLVAKGTGFLDEQVHLFDDTIRSGKTLFDMRRYLASCGNMTVCPRILWDARPSTEEFAVDGSALLQWSDAAA